MRKGPTIAISGPAKGPMRDEAERLHTRLKLFGGPDRFVQQFVARGERAAKEKLFQQGKQAGVTCLIQHDHASALYGAFHKEARRDHQQRP